MKRSVAAMVAVGVGGALLVAPTGAVAAQDSVDPPVVGAMPSEVPSAVTPAVTGTNVQSIAAVGSRMVIGGPFTAVAGVARDSLAAFDATSGALSPGFAPTVNGSVLSVLPGPVANTVYVGGKFTAINGTTVRNLALLSTVDGSLVPGFTVPTINGQVNDLEVHGGRLFVAGVFTKVGGVNRGGLATFNASTGAADPFLAVTLTERHNNSGSGATAAIGATAIDVSADGSKLVVVGNFRKADGLDRVQAALVDLTGATAQVQADWRTTRYEPLCFKNAFDTYMRAVSFSPDGSYFVPTTTGGPNPGTLCDTAARFETDATGQDVKPTWVIESGGDTLWAVAITSSAVFVGGHQRWLNNPLGTDNARTGAVPRAGLAALDPVSGRPLTWNPGRNPRGVAVFSMLATEQGLWMTYDTDWVGKRQYKRQKLAFFPYEGGTPLASTATATLPTQVFVGHGDQGQATNVLYRVNAGGGLVASSDSGPDWADDSGATSALRNAGSNAAGWSPVGSVNGSVPAGTPSAIFNSERWDPSGGEEMQWNFPVADGTPLQVRVYLANRCDCTASVGQRVFSMTLDGQLVLPSEDLVADAGHNVGMMKSYDIVSDGNVDLDFGHIVENPLVNAIEIVQTNVDPGPALGLTRSDFDGVTASTPVAVPSSIDWTAVRGAFAVGDQIYYGMSDATFWRAPLSGSSIGTPTKVDPYHDPKWMNVSTGSGTSTFDGATPAFYSQLGNVGGMFYDKGRLYYNQLGSSTLRWLWFSPDSGIVDGVSFTAPSSISFANTSGMFAAGGKLYFVDRSTGGLNEVDFANGAVTGSPTLISGPTTGGPDWRGRALFAHSPPPNQLPAASFTAICSGVDCQFDASTSSDPDGSVAEYLWDFGDGADGVGATPTHTYAEAGQYTVTLTVRDNDGGEGSSDDTVEPLAAEEGVGFVGVDRSSDAKSATKVVTPHPQTQVGDTMLMYYVGNTDVPAAPAGWTLESDTDNGTSFNTTVWSRVATADDLGQAVTLTQSSAQKATVSLATYSGFSSVASVTSAADVGVAMHASPEVQVQPGDYMVLLWTDKSSSTTDWTAPEGLVVRDEAIGSGSGRLTSLLADTDAPQSAGTYTSKVALTDAPSGRGLSFGIVLRP